MQQGGVSCGVCLGDRVADCPGALPEAPSVGCGKHTPLCAYAPLLQAQHRRRQDAGVHADLRQRRSAQQAEREGAARVSHGPLSRQVT